MKWMFTFAAAVALPLSLFTLPAVDFHALSWGELAGIGYVVVFGTFLAYICIMVGQKNLRPTVVGMYNYVQPIVATIVGVSLGLDRFTLPKIVAILLIFSGVYLVTVSRAAAPSPAKA